jgi:hypothetical protein
LELAPHSKGCAWPANGIESSSPRITLAPSVERIQDTLWPLSMNGRTAMRSMSSDATITPATPNANATGSGQPHTRAATSTSIGPVTTRCPCAKFSTPVVRNRTEKPSATSV